MSMKNSNDTIWIEPATFQLVAKYLNRCATISGPQLLIIYLYEIYKRRKAVVLDNN
jgi:hypothetical protein